MAVDDPRVVEIVAAYRAASGDPDQMPWLSVLPWKETDVWAQIVHALISSADRYRRAVGVDLMVCGVDSTAVPSLVTRLVSLSTMEADGVVLVAVVRALRRVGGRRGVRAIARLADCDSALVRAQVAYSLSIEADGQDGASVRRVLLVLGRDEDDGTREGAVFALARQSRSIDSRVVDLLWERALDHDRRVRSEAIAGLVLRGAPSLHDELFEMISANDDDVRMAMPVCPVQKRAF